MAKYTFEFYTSTILTKAEVQSIVDDVNQAIKDQSFYSVFVYANWICELWDQDPDYDIMYSISDTEKNTYNIEEDSHILRDAVEIAAHIGVLHERILNRYLINYESDE